MRGGVPARLDDGRAEDRRDARCSTGSRPVRRGFYSGALGYLDVRGGADLAVVIRSAFVRGGRAYLHAGGGIVADSEPGAEYAETRAKLQSLLEALASADPGDAPLVRLRRRGRRHGDSRPARPPRRLPRLPRGAREPVRARQRRAGALGLDQSAADRVARELDPIAHAELVEDVLTVTLDGLDADEERVGDLLRACTPRRSASAPRARAASARRTVPRRARRARRSRARASPPPMDRGRSRRASPRGTASTMSVSAPDLSTYPDAPALSASKRNCSLSYIDSISTFSSGLRLCSSAAAWMPVIRGIETSRIAR